MGPARALKVGLDSGLSHSQKVGPGQTGPKFRAKSDKNVEKIFKNFFFIFIEQLSIMQFPMPFSSNRQPIGHAQECVGMPRHAWGCPVFFK